MAFATSDDVATRLMRNLSAEETAGADLLLDAIAEEIAQAVNKEVADITDPGVLRFVSIEAACREIASPIGATQTGESLGAYSYNVSYRESGGTYLTQAEELLVRRAIHGSNSGSARLRSVADETLDYLEDYDVDLTYGS